MRSLLAVLALLLALPAAAGDQTILESRTGRTAGTILWKTLVTSFNCTDSYDTPAVTSAVDPTVGTNFDTFAEALDTLENLHDAVQTSGSPDGWCDDKPYVVLLADLPTGTTYYFGPYEVPPSGFRFAWDNGSAPTSYLFQWGVATPWDSTTLLPFWDSTGATSNNIVSANIGPLANGLLSFPYSGPLPVGDLYFAYTATGGTVIDFHSAIIPHDSRAYGDDR